MSNKSLILGTGAVVVVGILVWVGVRQGSQSAATSSPSPSTSTAVSPSVTPLPSDLSSLSPRSAEKLISGATLKYTPVPLSELKKPATCKVQGSIQFVKSNEYITTGAQISYTGIDNPARQIKWTVTPQDDLRVGPNFMANLPLPDGVREVGVTLPATPKVKSYALTAAMTYSRLVDNNPKDYEVACSGRVIVTLAY